MEARTAKQAYGDNVAKINEAIRKLQAGLKRHGKEFNGAEGHYGQNWGYPGDASYILDLVQQAAEFIGGKEVSE